MGEVIPSHAMIFSCRYSQGNQARETLKDSLRQGDEVIIGLQVPLGV